MVVGRSIAGTVDRYKSQVDAAIRDVSFAAIITFSKCVCTYVCIRTYVCDCVLCAFQWYEAGI